MRSARARRDVPSRSCARRPRPPGWAGSARARVPRPSRVELVVAWQEPFHPARDRQIERAQERLRRRPGPGPRRRLPPPEEAFDHAALPGQVELGHGHGGDRVVERVVGAAPLGERLVGEHEPVAERVLDQLLHVLHQHVVPAPARRRRARAPRGSGEIGPRRLAPKEMKDASSASPYSGGPPRARSLARERVADEARIDVDVAHGLLHAAPAPRSRAAARAGGVSAGSPCWG